MEQCKELQLSFSKIVNEFNTKFDIKTIKFWLDQILILFDVLDCITLDYEKSMIKPTIHGIFSWIISTNIFESFSKILDLSEDEDSSLAKVSTLRILWHISTGLVTFYSPNEDLPALIEDDGYYKIINEKLNDVELIIRIRDWIESSWVEVWEQAWITIGYFVMNNLDLRKPLEEYGIINVLLNTMSLEQVASINEYSLWCLFNIWRKYLPIAEKITRNQEDDVIFKIAYKIGEMLYGMETTSIYWFWYMILIWGYIFEHIVQYQKELKLLWDKIIELADWQEVTIINWWFITITRSVRADSIIAGFFNSPELFVSMQKYILSPTDTSLVKYVISFIKEISNENLASFESKLFSSLFFIHQSQSRSSKDVIQIFTNILKANGSKILLKQSKDFVKFALSSINDFKNENDKVISSIYHKDILTIDISYLLSALEMVYNLILETSNESMGTEATVDKIGKLEDTATFFFDCYTQWERDRSFSSNYTDSIIEEWCNIFLEVLKELGNKLVSTHIGGFSRDKSMNSAKDRLQIIIENLENKIYKTGPIDSEIRYKSNDILVKVYNLNGKENREFLMPIDVKFLEIEREIQDRYRNDFIIIQFEDISRQKITIDSDFTLDHAIKLADEISKRQRADQLTLELFVSEREGYIFNCLNWRSDFLKESKYGNNDFWDRWEDERRNSYNYRRSATPVINRSYTSNHTPAPRSRVTNSSFTRSQTHRTYTPTRARY